MQKVRIIEIPPMKAVYSGPITDGEKIGAFVSWFSAFHSSLKSELAPRDFMRYNERIGDGISIEDLYLPIEIRTQEK